MKPHQISIGLSSIKLQLIRKLSLDKQLTEMDIWFSVEDGVLYVHDYDEHKSCMAIALVDNSIKKHFLEGFSFDVEVVRHAFHESVAKRISIAEKLNDLYDSNGFWRSR